MGRFLEGAGAEWFAADSNRIFWSEVDLPAAACTRVLSSADTFYFGPDALTLIRSSYDSLPEFHVRLSDLPSVSGFCWFEHSPICQKPYDGVGKWDMRALSWSLASDGGHIDLVPYFEYPKWRTPMPLCVGQWRFGHSWEDCSEASGLWTQNFTMIARYLATCWVFMQQRILTSSRESPERHTRKRLVREGHPVEGRIIHVVELRRREHVGDKQSVQPVEREWSCQWVVRGHWRQQWYAKAQRNQPIWITPYVKGPEDKPLRPPRATVFAVVR